MVPALEMAGHRRRAGLMALTVPVYLRLGSEFMPPLDEGDLLFMPTTLPGISVAQAQHLLQVQDRILMRFPEVESVMGKAGRAETSTDPAPFPWRKTTIVLKPKSSGAKCRPGTASGPHGSVRWRPISPRTTSPPIAWWRK